VAVTAESNLTLQGVALGPFNDYGAGGHPPAVAVDIPNTLAKENVVAASGTAVFATVLVNPVNGQTTVPSPQTVVADLYVSVKY